MIFLTERAGSTGKRVNIVHESASVQEYKEQEKMEKEASHARCGGRSRGLRNPGT